MALIINDDNFKTEVEQSSKPVILDVYADWCPPCQMMVPIFEELEREYSSKYVFAKLNVDESRDLSINLGISSIPTFIFFKDGKIATKAVGFKSKQEMEDIIQKYLI